MDLEKKISNIILLGPASTGSKILRDLISQHPLIDKIPYDVTFIWRLGNANILHDELHTNLLTKEKKNKIIKHLHHFHQGAPFLLDKTNSNSLRVPFVHAVLPEAFFIHLLRNPLDVVQSSYRRWQEPPDFGYIFRKARKFPILDAFGYASRYAKNAIQNLFGYGNKSWGQVYIGMDEDLKTKQLLEVCSIQYVKSVEKAIESLREINKDKIYTIYYEDFVMDPEKCLREIAVFLNLDHKSFSNVDTSIITTRNIGKGARNLSNEEKSVVQPILNRLINLYEDREF